MSRGKKRKQSGRPQPTKSAEYITLFPKHEARKTVPISSVSIMGVQMRETDAFPQNNGKYILRKLRAEKTVKNVDEKLSNKWGRMFEKAVESFVQTMYCSFDGVRFAETTTKDLKKTRNHFRSQGIEFTLKDAKSWLLGELENGNFSIYNSISLSEFMRQSLFINIDNQASRVVLEKEENEKLKKMRQERADDSGDLGEKLINRADPELETYSVFAEIDCELELSLGKPAGIQYLCVMCDGNEGMWDELYQSSLVCAAEKWYVQRCMFYEMEDSLDFESILPKTDEELFSAFMLLYDIIKNVAENSLVASAVRQFYSISDDKGKMQILKELEKLKKTVDRKVTEVDKFKDTIKAKNEEIAAVRAELGKKNDDISARVNAAVKKSQKENEDRNYALQSENKKLRKELDILREKYTNVLKDVAESDEQEETLQSSGQQELFTDEDVKNMRIVFVRDISYSHNTYFNGLLKEFPNSKVIDTNAASINATATDVVVLMTRYVCHGSYWGTRDECREKGIPVIHCKYTNVDIIKQTIKEGMSKVFV